MDLFLKMLLGALLFFAPFSFAAAEPWAFSVLQGGVFLSLLLLVFSRRRVYLTPLLKPVFFTLGFLALYALVQCVAPQTLLDAPAPYPSTLMRLYTLEHASLFVTYLGLAFLVSQLADCSETVGKFILAAGVCGVLVALCATCLPPGEYIYALTGVRGGFGPFLNRNHGGIFLASCAVLCLGWWCAAFKNPAARCGAGGKNVFYFRQILGGLAVAGMGTAAVFSRSRGGMLSLACGVFCFAFLCAGLVPEDWKKRVKFSVLAGAALAVCACWAWTHVDEINAFAHRTTGASVQTRRVLYRAAGKMLQDYPLWGIGVGALPVAVTSYMDTTVNEYVERLHGDWLEILTGVGYVGGVFILFGLGWFAYAALKRTRRLETLKKIRFAALLSALVVTAAGAGADFPFFIPGDAFIFFVVLGLACSPVFWKRRTEEIPVSAAVRAAAAAVCLAAFIIPLGKTAAWRMFVFGRNLKPETRLRYYEKGLSYYPGPHFAVRLGNSYYNASLGADTPEEAARLRALANQTAVEYLQKYPKDKELSALYMRSRP